MGNSVYAVNKGINKSIEFRGLKAQYIWWLAGGIIGLMIVFAIMYIIGINTYICLGIIGLSGTGWVMYVYRLSNKYGEHGMMKHHAKRKVPAVIVARSRHLFMKRLGRAHKK